MFDPLHPDASKHSVSHKTVGRGRSQRHMTVIGERHDQPDVERIARSIIDLATYLAESDLTLEEHTSRVREHAKIKASLRRRRRDVEPGALPGCRCRSCSKHQD